MDDKELQLKFLQFLVKKSGAKTQKDLEKYVQSLGEEGLKKAYEEFSKEVINEQNKKVNKAAHGMKLNYVKNLKNQCADDEELVYFKKGGTLDCGCRKKMEKGGETPKEENVISKFKKRMDSGFKRISDKLSEKREGYDKYGNYIVPKEKIKKRDAEKGKLSGVDEEEAVDMKPKKNRCGSKLKLKKKGGEVHSAGAGCTVAKFKIHRQGGSLNRVPFYQKGTSKGGLPTAQKATERYKGARGIMYGNDKVTIQEIENPNTRAKIELDILGNDSTITETPPHSWYITPKHRISTNRRFSIPPYDLMDGDEWNIMKRRWEEAKKVMNKTPYYAGPLYGTYPLPK